MSEFVEVKTAELIGAALDWAVGQIEEVKLIMLAPKNQSVKKPFALFGSQALPVGNPEEGYAPSSCWHCGGPLIDKFKLDIGAPMEADPVSAWNANTEWGHPHGCTGPTALIAACRAIVVSQIGATVSVPRELLP